MTNQSNLLIVIFNLAIAIDCLSQVVSGSKNDFIIAGNKNQPFNNSYELRIIDEDSTFKVKSIRNRQYRANTAFEIILLKFELYLDNDRVFIGCTIQSDHNSSFFGIERSQDNFNWETIRKVNVDPAVSGERHYQFYDSFPSPGINYYRIKSWDNNGNYENLDRKSIEVVKLNTITIFPNPVKTTLTIRFYKYEELGTIKIFNESGNEVWLLKSEVRQANCIKLDFGDLPPGVYLIKSSTSVEKIIHL